LEIAKGSALSKSGRDRRTFLLTYPEANLKLITSFDLNLNVFRSHETTKRWPELIGSNVDHTRLKFQI